MKKIIFILLLLYISINLFGQTNTGKREFDEAIASGDMTLTANGNGSSTGMSIYGTVRNNTSNNIRIYVIIKNGIYLANSGEGQNMIATQIFLLSRQIEYFIEGDEYFIDFPGSSISSVVFAAFCADYERSNPSKSENFNVAPTPQKLKEISSTISRYMADNFDENLVIAAQLALWRSQGKSRMEIMKTFEFDDNDWNISNDIMNY